MVKLEKNYEGVSFVVNCATQHKKYTKMVRKFGPCLIQEYIPNGGEYGVYTLFNNQSEPLALTVQKRIRSLHSYGGISTFKETVQNDQIVDIAFHLLKTLRWFGVAMVEFRIDPRDGQPKLIEVNPRFWGSLQLSILAGVDFPYLVLQLMTEKYIEPMLTFKKGVQCRWLMGDIALFLRSPHNLKQMRTFLKIHCHDDIASFSDPWPMVMSVLAPSWHSLDEEPRDDNITSVNNESKRGHL